MHTNALLCRACSWFGVYRADVTERMTGCPRCGRVALVVRDSEAEDEQWRELGRQLLDEAPPAGLTPDAAGPPEPRPQSRAHPPRR